MIRRGRRTPASASRGHATSSTPRSLRVRRCSCRNRSRSNTASTATEWIDAGQTPVSDSPFLEPNRTAEANAARFGESGGRGVVLRFGVFQAADAAHTIAAFDAARRGMLLDLVAPDGYQPAIDADDAATAVVAALAAPSGTYDIVDEPITRREYAHALARAVGRRRLTSMRPMARAGGSKANVARVVATGFERQVRRRDRVAAGVGDAPRHSPQGRGGDARRARAQRCRPRPALASRVLRVEPRRLRAVLSARVLRRLPVRAELGRARRSLQRAPRPRFRRDEPRAHCRHARRALLRLTRGCARGRGRLDRVLRTALRCITCATSSTTTPPTRSATSCRSRARSCSQLRSASCSPAHRRRLAPPTAARTDVNIPA